MTCSSCGVHGTVQRTTYCARCLLIAVEAGADGAISLSADESPPCELLSIMGESSRAMTFLGEQTWPVRRLVALRVLKDARLRAMSAFTPEPIPRHPGIARVLETGRLAGRPYVMTAYLAGGTLPTCYDRHRLGAEARMRALVGIAGAVAVAHTNGRVHGRLGASNLLCEPRSPFAVRIVDFDVAPVPSGDAEFDELVRADLAHIVRIAEDLLRSPIARVPDWVALSGELRRVGSAHRAADMVRALENLAARL